MSGRLQGKVAVITGGTSGIGEATAELFVQEGAMVLIAGRNREKGAALVKQLGPNAAYQEADVMREADIAAVVERAATEFGRIDCLFNNAGGPTEGRLEDLTMEQFNYGMQLLLASVLFGIKHVVPVMKKNGGGSIINNSSIAALRVNQGNMLYSIAKAAVTHVTKLAGVELGPYNIRVNAISPGAIATPIFWGGSQRASKLTQDDNAGKMAKLEANLANATPIPRAGLARDIAAGALYLASDEGSFVNCLDLVIDGGRTSLFYNKPPARTA